MRSVSRRSVGRLVAALVIAGGLLIGSLIGSAGAHFQPSLNHLRSHFDHLYSKTFYRFETSTDSITNGSEAFASPECPAGTRPTGGGAYAPENWTIVTSYPTLDGGGPVGWGSHVRNETGGTSTGPVTVYVACQRSKYVNSTIPVAVASNASGR